MKPWGPNFVSVLSEKVSLQLILLLELTALFTFLWHIHVMLLFVGGSLLGRSALFCPVSDVVNLEFFFGIVARFTTEGDEHS